MELATPTPNAAPPPRLGFARGLGLAIALALVGFGLATLPVLKVMGTLTIALVLGITWRATAGLPAGSAGGLKFAGRTLLRLGIVLLGARLNYGLIVAAGPKILIIDLAVVVVGIAGIAWMAGKAGLPRQLGVLMAVGTGICGASAVAAASSVTRADEESTALALALMGILGTFGVFLYVGLGSLLGLGPSALGVLTGSTLHEVAQVVAAAFTFGPEAGDMGTMVKLTRVVMLAPALLVVGWIYHRGAVDGANHRYTWKEPPIPYFVLGFLAVGAINSAGWLNGPAQGGLTQASVLLMAVAMAAMGLNTDLGAIRRTGWTAIGVGLSGFFVLVALSYGLIRAFGL
jgi:uncharacterized integral membrane protein (TIGR00698 family)